MTTKIKVFVGQVDVGGVFVKVTGGEFTYINLDMKPKALVGLHPQNNTPASEIGRAHV